ncbi:molybdate ABC transporter permease subunit [Govanella unica]|uniref:Molybdenum transport system permease n=1 Tax=Govanella unica TaxID=2975056 RepID=A0A9X3Z806_9PROT|nr:molybdate ABC transporter permease subunit [Govania unica]MDA5194747.1 molybdate ABC transporter permease subunit [Govania unica]
MMTLTPEEWTAVRLSLKVATVAALCSLPVGLGLALLLARGRFWGRGILGLFVYLPLVLPPVVTGYLLLVLFGRNGVLGAPLAEHFGIVFAFRWTGAALAAAIMGLPLMVRTMVLSLQAVDHRLEQAASTLGAGRLRVFATITLPLAAPGILAGTILSFAKAFGEFGATITFVSAIPGVSQTLPVAIYGYTQMPGGDAAVLRLTLVAVVISMTALGLSEWLAQRVTRQIAGQNARAG